MYADDVLSYLQSKFNLISPIIQKDIYIFNSQMKQSEIRIEFINEIGHLNKPDFYRIRKDIKNFIEQDLTHAVCGGYTFNNFIESPHNSCLIIYDNSNNGIELKVMVYFRKDQMTFSGNHELTNEIYEIIHEILALREKIFIFTSGEMMINYVKEKTTYDNNMNNVVMVLKNKSLLQENLKIKGFSCIEYSDKIFPKLKVPLSEIQIKNLHILNDYTHYSMNIEELHDLVLKRPQIVIIEDSSGKPVARARANSCQPEFSIIGGVHTNLEFRRKRLGWFACSKLTKILNEKSSVVALDTDLENIAARKLYKSIGFVDVGKSAFFDKKTSIIPQLIGDRDY